MLDFHKTATSLPCFRHAHVAGIKTDGKDSRLFLELRVKGRRSAEDFAAEQRLLKWKPEAESAREDQANPTGRCGLYVFFLFLIISLCVALRTPKLLNERASVALGFLVLRERGRQRWSPGLGYFSML